MTRRPLAGAGVFRRWQTWIGFLNFGLCFGAARQIIDHGGHDSPLHWLVALLLLLASNVAFLVIVATAEAAALWKEVLEREDR